MSKMSKLVQHRDTVLAVVEQSARKKDALAVLREMQTLQSLVNFITRQQELDEEVDRTFVGKGFAASPASANGSATNRHDSLGIRDDDEVSSRERGRAVREAFVKGLAQRGVSLSHLKSVIYRTISGSPVGIAFARERNPAKWFLGLPDNKFRHAVLICGTDRSEFANFVLPKEFLDQYGSNLSCQAENRKTPQIKFNVRRDEAGYSLHVPDVGWINIDSYRDNVACLK